MWSSPEPTALVGIADSFLPASFSVSGNQTSVENISGHVWTSRFFFSWCRDWGFFFFFRQTYQIPTMKNGPDLAKRFYKELTDIQVRNGSDVR